jgi:hypothetical protein
MSTDDRESLPPLPGALRDELRSLREATPDPARLDAVFAALLAEPASARAPTEERRSRRSASPRLWPALAMLVPTGAVAAAAVGLALRLAADPAEEAAAERELEHEIELWLPHDTHATADLDIAAEHHEDAPARVVVEAPEHVAVHLGGDALRARPAAPGPGGAGAGRDHPSRGLRHPGSPRVARGACRAALPRPRDARRAAGRRPGRRDAPALRRRGLVR